MTSPFTSIKSVLYKLSNLIPEAEWNEEDFTEWCYEGLHALNLHVKYEHAVCTLAVASHKATLPSDFKYLTQIAYVTSSDLESDEIEAYREIMGLEQEDWNPATSHMTNPDGLPEKAVKVFNDLSRIRWKPLRATSNPFLATIDDTVSLFTNSDFDPTNAAKLRCDHEYTVDPTGCITTTLPEGLLLVAYLRYPQDTLGVALIPDNIHVKNAIMYYALWMYFMKKHFLTGEQKDERQIDRYLSMFQTAKIKVAGMFHIDVDTMENIKAHRDHLVPRSERYNGFFSQLNQRENENPNMSSNRYYW